MSRGAGPKPEYKSSTMNTQPVKFEWDKDKAAEFAFFFKNMDTNNVSGAMDMFETNHPSKVLPVSEPVKERIDISRLQVHDNFRGNGNDSFWYQFCSSKYLSISDCSKLSDKIESALNDTVVEDRPVVIDEDAFENRCNVCGDNLVFIRGKYPNTDKRPTCPTCTTERLEQISEISNKDYGKAYTNKN